MMIEIGETVGTFAVAAMTGLVSSVASWAAMKVTLKYMAKDIERAQDTADNAHERIDKALGYNGGKRHYDPSEFSPRPLLP